MLTPLVLIIAYLCSTFLLGLALGWLLWQFGYSKEMGSMTTEIQYWKDRLQQSRNESSLVNDKVSALESERDSLKKRLMSAAPDKS